MTEERAPDLVPSHVAAKCWCPAEMVGRAGVDWGPSATPLCSPHAGHRDQAVTAKHRSLGGLARRHSFSLNAQGQGVGRLVSSRPPPCVFIRLPSACICVLVSSWREDASPTGCRFTPQPRSDIFPSVMTLSAMQSHSETLGVRTST